MPVAMVQVLITGAGSAGSVRCCARPSQKWPSTLFGGRLAKGCRRSAQSKYRFIDSGYALGLCRPRRRIGIPDQRRARACPIRVVNRSIRQKSPVSAQPGMGRISVKGGFATDSGARWRIWSGVCAT